MQIVIVEKQDMLTDNFYSWLIEEIQTEFISKINPKKLEAWNKYLTQNFRSVYKKRVSAKDILLAGIYNLQVTKSSAKLTIEINDNVFVPYLDRVKVKTVCKLINFGNAEMQAYPIFSTVFQNVTDNFNSYIDKYVSLV